MNPDDEPQINTPSEELEPLNLVSSPGGTTLDKGDFSIKRNLRVERNASIGNTQLNPSQRVIGAVTDLYEFVISVGPEDVKTGASKQISPNMQMSFLHYPNNTSKQSFLTVTRKPLKASDAIDDTSTTLGGTTATLTGQNFVINELAGALIEIYNSAGTHIETQVIASNTATVVTITGTWLATTTGTFLIYVPVFIGAANFILQRFYTQEGTPGGIRFGMGPTNGGQNGLLYMDAAGDLYWRNKAGASTQLAAALSGTYTPTITGAANLDATPSASVAQYMRVGNTVTVSGRFTVNPTLTATTTSFEMDFPIAGIGTSNWFCGGVAFAGGIAGQGASISLNVSNNTAWFQWVSTDINNQNWSYSYTYRII